MVFERVLAVWGKISTLQGRVHRMLTLKSAPTLHPGCEVGIYSIVCIIIYYAKNMIIKFIQAKRDVTQMA